MLRGNRETWVNVTLPVDQEIQRAPDPMRSGDRAHRPSLQQVAYVLNPDPWESETLTGLKVNIHPNLARPLFGMESDWEDARRDRRVPIPDTFAVQVAGSEVD